MRYILAHDLGTSGNKATLFSEDGRLIKSEVFSYDAHYFNDTWVEQNADDWWNAVCRTSSSLIQSTGVDPREIGAISFSGQMMGCLCVDRNGTPLRPSIIWADQRAQKQVAQIEEHISQQDFYHIVGHRNTASYGIQKLMWVRDNEPEIYEQTYKTLNAKDYIVFKLTGKFYTEPSDANSVACFDLKTFQWSEEILKITGIDPDKLPQIKPSTFVAGGVTREAARATGLAEGTPVYGGNLRFMETKVSVPEAARDQALALAENGKTPLFFGSGERFLGIIAVADVIKEDSPRAVKELQNMGIRVVMLTGDNERTARAVGREAGVDEVIAGVLPDGKESAVRALKEQGRVAMVGDGINDAPALTRADTGIAIGAGTDIAIDAADVVLMKSRLSDVPAAIRLSRAALRNIHENLFWAFFYNVVGIPLAMGLFIPVLGWKLNPMFGAAAAGSGFRRRHIKGSAQRTGS